MIKLNSDMPFTYNPIRKIYERISTIETRENKNRKNKIKFIKSTVRTYTS